MKAAGGLLLAAWSAWQLRPSLEAAPAGLLIALAANLFNLLDLRPLRALKAFWLLGSLLLAGGAPFPLAALLGLSLAYVPQEARRTVMLGDTGANALGAVMGIAAVVTLPSVGVVPGARSADRLPPLGGEVTRFPPGSSDIPGPVPWTAGAGTGTCVERRRRVVETRITFLGTAAVLPGPGEDTACYLINGTS